MTQQNTLACMCDSMCYMNFPWSAVVLSILYLSPLHVVRGTPLPRTSRCQLYVVYVE